MGTPEPAPTWWPAPRSRVEPSTNGLVVTGPIAAADVPRLCDRAREVLEVSVAEVVDCDVRALVHPDLGTLEVLARVALTAGRLGRRIRLSHASAELRNLLALAGLTDVVPCAAASAVEPCGQAEEREEPRGVEEEGDPADPAV